MLSSTSSPHAIVGQDELALVTRSRQGRPLLLIDIAVPRDVDPRCGDLDGVTLYDIDDLQATVARNLDLRQDQAPDAEAIVEDEIRRFARWLGQADTRPTIAALHERGQGIVEQVLAENAGRWESASPRDLARVEAIARAVSNRLLHEPTIRLRGTADDRSHSTLQVVRELFGLDEGPRRQADDASAGRGEADNVRALDRSDRASGSRGA